MSKNIKETDDEEALTIKYLLGELSYEEELGFENRFFCEDRFVEELEAVREDLIDRYIVGEMSELERKAFENKFLSSPYHKEKLKFSQSMHEILLKEAPSKSTVMVGKKQASPWHFILAPFKINYRSMALATATLLISVGSYFWFRNHTALPPTSEVTTNLTVNDANPDRQISLSQDSDPNPTASNDPIQQRNTNHYAQSGKDSPTPPDTKPPNSKSSDRIVAFALTPSIRSGEEAKPFEIPKRTASVELLITQPLADYLNYRVALSTVEGQEVWSQKLTIKNNEHLKQLVKVTIPAKIFNNQDYILDLSRVNPAGEPESINKYSFRVVKSK